MDFTYSFAIGFALSQACFALALLLRAGLKTIQQRLFALLMLAVIGYLSVPELSGTPLSYISTSLRTAVPALFWLFNASLFDDHFKLKQWKIMLVLFTVLLPLIGLVSGDNHSAFMQILLYELPQLLEFVLVGLALFAIARHWRIDLVQSRRTLRVWLGGFNGCYIFIFILLQQVVLSNENWVFEYQYLTAAIGLFINNLLLYSFHQELLNVKSEEVVAAKSSDSGSIDDSSQQMAEPLIDPVMMERLRSAMEDKRLYAQTGLTIAQLAAELEMQEYKLRQMINQQLGYRNFNDFLNRYRIAETAERLQDPEQVKLPVLTIALDVGFRSLSPFNKAFKNKYGVTPSEYRKSHLAGN